MIPKHFIILLVSLICFGFSNQLHSSDFEEQDIKSYIKEFIAHHLKDSHSFGITSFKDENGEKVYIELPLPVVLYDNGFKTFMSSQFKHGKKTVKSGDNFYKMNYDNNRIYNTDSSGTIVFDDSGKITNKKPIDFSITKNVVVIIFTALFMLWLFTSLARSYKKNNGIASGFARLFEPVVLYVRDDIARPNIGEKHYKKYMSFLLTIFFFVLFLNLFGLTPIGINVTGNIAITFSLALLTFVITNITANKNYWMHIFWMPGVPTLMKIVLAPIEVLGLFIKPLTLMIRLYANMQGGHIVIMSIIGLMFIFSSWLGSSLSFVLAFFLMIIEVFVALLQAYIFTILSALYFGFANEEHEH